MNLEYVWLKFILLKGEPGKEHELGKGKAKVSSLRESDQREVILNIKKKNVL